VRPGGSNLLQRRSASLSIGDFSLMWIASGLPTVHPENSGQAI
jgi:hypothetical protein